MYPPVALPKVRRMQTKTADQQWRILNRILDAQNEDQDRRVETVLRAVFRFLNAALAEHPYYGKVGVPLERDRVASKSPHTLDYVV